LPLIARFREIDLKSSERRSMSATGRIVRSAAVTLEAEVGGRHHDAMALEKVAAAVRRRGVLPVLLLVVALAASLG
jgi:hypothetical protein